MHHRIKTRQLLLLLAYGAYFVAPLVHGILEAPQRCDEYRATPYHGRVFLPDCYGPCDDPTHHHHGSHDTAHCIICQSCAVSHVADWAFRIDLRFTTTVARIPDSRLVPSSMRRFRPDVPRAPPAFAVSA